jgi:hypothetical protein
MKHPVWVASLAAGLLTLTACSSSAGPIVAPATVDCDTLAALDSYHASSLTSFNLTDTAGTATPNTGDLPPFEVSWQVEMDSVEGGDEKQGVITSSDGPASSTTDFIIVGEDEWVTVEVASGGFTKLPPSGSAVPFPPEQTCQGLAADLDLESMQGSPESVNDVRATKYEVKDLPASALGDVPALGPGADAVNIVEDYDGTVWVAEDGYIAKLDITGDGKYEGGRQALNVRIAFEYSGINDTEADVSAPQTAAPR